MRDLQQYALDALAETLAGETGTADDLRSTIERAEDNFDFDSYAPYTNQEDDVIREYEKDFWQDAADICDGGQEFKPSEWDQAKRQYVSALGYVAFTHYYAEAKDTMTEEIDELADYIQTEFSHDPSFTVTRSCPHGWASHDEETADGTHVWRSKQLDGCNGVSKQIGECWVTCTWTPEANENEAAS